MRPPAIQRALCGYLTRLSLAMGCQPRGEVVLADVPAWSDDIVGEVPVFDDTVQAEAKFFDQGGVTKAGVWMTGRMGGHWCARDLMMTAESSFRGYRVRRSSGIEPVTSVEVVVSALLAQAVQAAHPKSLPDLHWVEPLCVHGYPSGECAGLEGPLPHHCGDRGWGGGVTDHRDWKVRKIRAVPRLDAPIIDIHAGVLIIEPGDDGAKRWMDSVIPVLVEGPGISGALRVRVLRPNA